MSNSAKAEILQRIRNAQKIAYSGRDLAGSAGIVTGEPGKKFDIPREYTRSTQIDRASLLALADERIADYKADVRRCEGNPASVAAAVGQALRDVADKLGRPVQSIGVPEGLNQAWLGEYDGEVRVDKQLGVRELDALDAIVTSSAVTCAETGTIFLDGSAECGRRALTLVPDVHVCVVPADSIVHGIPESIERIHAKNPQAPITMISGPSATSDIELSRVEGVHGPRTLIVIIAG